MVDKMPPPDADPSQTPPGAPSQKKPKIIHPVPSTRQSKHEPVRRSDLIYDDLEMSQDEFRKKILRDCRALSAFAEQAQMRINR